MIGENELGWLAGIIDGEGCFTIRLLKSETKTLGVRPRFQPQLTIVNTNEEIISRACSILTVLGVKHRKFLRHRKNYNGKPLWTMDCYANGLRTLLPVMTDLLCKKKQALIISEALEIGARHQKEKSFSSNEDLLRLDELRSELVGLHGRQALKLIKLKASELQKTDEEFEKARKAKREHASKMVLFRWHPEPMGFGLDRDLK